MPRVQHDPVAGPHTGQDLGHLPVGLANLDRGRPGTAPLDPEDRPTPVAAEKRGHRQPNHLVRSPDGHRNLDSIAVAHL